MKTALRWIAFIVVLFVGWTLAHLGSFFIAMSAASWLAVLLHIFMGGISGVGGFAAVTIAPHKKVGGVLALLLLAANEIGSFNQPDAETWPLKVFVCRAIVDFFLVIGIVQAAFLKDDDIFEESQTNRG
jgi:hypothetical protein